MSTDLAERKPDVSLAHSQDGEASQLDLALLRLCSEAAQDPQAAVAEFNSAF